MKYLALDIGNVLVNVDMEPFVKAISIQMNISKAEVFHFINRIQKNQDLGLTNIKDEVSTHFNIKSEYILDNLLNAWQEVVKLNYHSIRVLEDYTFYNNIKVALLSNLGFEHLNYFTKEFDNYNLWNDSIHHFSCNVGARKPHSLYYKSFLDLHPEFKGCLYIDDLEENLKIGRDLGFKTHCFDLSKYKTWELESHLVNLKTFLSNSI